MFQAEPQSITSPGKPGPDGPHRPAKSLGRFVMSPPLEIAQLHRQAVFLRQELDLVVDGGAQFVAFYERVGWDGRDLATLLDRAATGR